MIYHREVVFTLNGALCAIWTQTYAKSVAHIANLVFEAHKDFDGLEDEDIGIYVYNGPARRGFYSIQFRVDNGVIPESYTVVNKFPMNY